MSKKENPMKNVVARRNYQSTAATPPAGLSGDYNSLSTIELTAVLANKVLLVSNQVNNIRATLDGTEMESNRDTVAFGVTVHGDLVAALTEVDRIDTALSHFQGRFNSTGKVVGEAHAN